MPIEWAIIFFITICACVYFSWMSGFKKGVEEAVLLTLAQLESSKIIEIEDGKIKPLKK